ncbi:gliding motility-associated-like protein [Mesonia hippocampi]|uniref:Gliding motility-associated-like protein n=1 Tax=Mesonia hippocampi TaxID=1628250 RepID=A0A840EPY4_9FLAO|nr:gliding motility-associated C-terminal domain-containing protein [Mesonia hippocampi]MBB4119050.1 gliding motility-associated-like protein [Mesonia hippocampi]
MKHIIKIASIALCVFCGSPYAQTTNEGMFYVSEGTQFSTLADLDNKPTGAFINDGEAFIYESFNNDGLVDFYSNTGLTRFIGSNTQLLSGIQPSAFYNIYFDNTSSEVPFHLSGNIEAYGLVDFFEGIVDNDNHGGSFLFSTNADHVSTSNLSHVDGFVHKIGATEFTYPIGDKGYYRYAKISSPQNTGANFKGKYYFENSNSLYPHAQRSDAIVTINEKEYWEIKEVPTAQDNVLVSLSWDSATTPANFIAAAENGNLTIVRWDEDLTLWTDEGGIIDVDAQTVTTAVSLEKYGMFTFAILNEKDLNPCNIVVYNSVTPNGDGINDYFIIDNIHNNECISELEVQVFNRWGVKVFETSDYDTSGNVFDGFSTGRLTVKDKDILPTGTYFYIITYTYNDGGTAGNRRHKKAGYLYLNSRS